MYSYIFIIINFCYKFYNKENYIFYNILLYFINMNDIFYFTIIIIMTIFMLLYGGHNFRRKIIYDSDYFLIFNRINFLTDEIKKKTFYIQNKHKNKNYIMEISKNLLHNKYIPNCSKIYIINIKPKGIINIDKLMEQEKLDKNVYLMIIFDYLENNINNGILNLIIDDNYNNTNNALFYLLNKKINIFDIFNIYNPNNHNILFSLFLIKKPFWSC
jgi:hypothetical protein